MNLGKCDQELGDLGIAIEIGGLAITWLKLGLFAKVPNSAKQTNLCQLVPSSMLSS